MTDSSEPVTAQVGGNQAAALSLAIHLVKVFVTETDKNEAGRSVYDFNTWLSERYRTLVTDLQPKPKKRLSQRILRALGQEQMMQERFGRD